MSAVHKTPDVVVVGAGAIGLSIAWRAAVRGLHVVVLERRRPGTGTSRVAAGMIAPVSEAVAGEPALLRLALAGARMYPRFVRELEAASGGEVGYRQRGTLLVARDGDEAEALEREIELRGSLGLEVERLLPSQARRVEPALAPGMRLAAAASGDHAVDPRALCGCLATAASRAGAEIRSHVEVAGAVHSAGRVRGVRLRDGSVVEGRTVVLAGGVEAELLDGLPDVVRRALRPVKGQLLVLRDPAGSSLLSLVLRTGDLYVVPRGDGRYVVGATMEERGFDRSVTAGAVWSLLDSAVRLLPGVAEMVLEEALAGLRPGTADNAPLLGEGFSSGLFWALGHYRHGVLLTPATGELIAAALAGEPVPEALEEVREQLPAFHPERFGGSVSGLAPGGARDAVRC